MLRNQNTYQFLHLKWSGTQSVIGPETVKNPTMSRISNVLVFAAVLSGAMPTWGLDGDDSLHMCYYVKVATTTWTRGRFRASSVDMRRLRFGAMIYVRQKGAYLGSNGQPMQFLHNEKTALSDAVLKRDTATAAILAQSIVSKELTYLPALEFLADCRSIDKKTKRISARVLKSVLASIRNSGDGRSVETAYEVFARDEEDFMLGDRWSHSGSIIRGFDKNGREYLSVQRGGTAGDTSSMYFDVTAGDIGIFAPPGTDLQKEIEAYRARLERLAPPLTTAKRQVSASSLSERLTARGDSLANGFIALYEDGKWDALWDLYKEKSRYYNPHEEFDKRDFFILLRGAYDTCGTFRSAEQDSFAAFAHGNSLTTSLEYRFRAHYDKCDRTIYLEIWTVRDTIDKFHRFGFARTNDKE